MIGGHYTTYALNYINLSWYEYDDQTVTEIDPQQVENCEAYVLFYRSSFNASYSTHALDILLHYVTLSLKWENAKAFQTLYKCFLQVGKYGNDA